MQQSLMPAAEEKCFILTRTTTVCYFRILETLKQPFATVGHSRFTQMYKQTSQICHILTTAFHGGFDPPHLLRNVGKSKFADIYGILNPKASPTGYQQIKYGALPNTDWRDC